VVALKLWSVVFGESWSGGNSESRGRGRVKGEKKGVRQRTRGNNIGPVLQSIKPWRGFLSGPSGNRGKCLCHITERAKNEWARGRWPNGRAIEPAERRRFEFTAISNLSPPFTRASKLLLHCQVRGTTIDNGMTPVETSATPYWLHACSSAMTMGQAPLTEGK
jgi:hypothetical protein